MEKVLSPRDQFKGISVRITKESYSQLSQVQRKPNMFTVIKIMDHEI